MSLQQRPARIAFARRMGRHGWFRLSGYGVFVVAAALVAFWKLYSQFSAWDDEGYALLSIKEFIRLGGLYNHVYSQYGPFPYELWGALYSIFGRSPTPDSARLFVIVLWVAYAVLAGLAVDRVAKNVLAGLIAAIVAFATVGVISNEPLIPDDLTAELTMLIITVSALLSHRERLRMAIIGAILGAILFTKINLGGAALLALCLSVSVYSPTLRQRPWIARLFVVLGVLMPIVLMAHDLGQVWAEDLAFVIAAGIAAVGIAVWPAGDREHPRVEHRHEFVWVLAGFGAAAVVVLVVIIALGTSVGQLIHGVVLDPLGQRNAFAIADALPGPAVDLSVVGVVCAILARRAAAPSRSNPLSGLFRLVLGLAILLEAVSQLALLSNSFTTTLTLALPFAWLVIRPSGSYRGWSERQFARLLMAALPVYGAIGVYPVAGSQNGYAAAAFIPAAAVILSDGARQLQVWLAERQRAQAGTFGIVGTALLIALGYQLLLQQGVTSEAAYRQLTPLPIAGASHVRQPSVTAQAYGGLVETLKTRCSTFVTLPGMNSFYLWTGKNPPTGLNVTSWMYLLNSSQQQQIVDAVKNVRNLCLVSNPQVLSMWEGGGPPPSRPLMRFVSSGFKPIYAADGYTISLRRA